MPKQVVMEWQEQLIPEMEQRVRLVQEELPGRLVALGLLL